MKTRGVRWQFLVLLLSVLALASFCHAATSTSAGSVPESPIVTHKDNNSQREFQNVYQAIKNPTINVATISSMTVTFSSITNLSLGGNLNANNFKIINIANGSATTDAAAFGQIIYLQEPNATVSNATGFSTTSNSFQDTGLSVSIQPSLSTSKVRISLTGVIGVSATVGAVALLTISRGSTDLSASGNGFCQVTNVAANAIRVPCSINIIDSPATTSSLTYKARLKNTDGTTSVIFTPATDANIIVDEVR